MLWWRQVSAKCEHNSLWFSIAWPIWVLFHLFSATGHYPGAASLALFLVLWELLGWSGSAVERCHHVIMQGKKKSFAWCLPFQRQWMHCFHMRYVFPKLENKIIATWSGLPLSYLKKFRAAVMVTFRIDGALRLTVGCQHLKSCKGLWGSI